MITISQATHFQPSFVNRCKQATPWIMGFALPILLYLTARHQKVTTRTLVALGFGTTTVACCAYGLKRRYSIRPITVQAQIAKIEKTSNERPSDPFAKTGGVIVWTSCENDPFSSKKFPKEIKIKILFNLDYSSILQMGKVSKQWKSLSDESIVWKHALTCYLPGLVIPADVVNVKLCFKMAINPDTAITYQTIFGKSQSVRIPSGAPVWFVKEYIASSLKDGTTSDRIQLFYGTHSFQKDEILTEVCKQFPHTTLNVSIFPKA